eukprot:412925-Alexandrium_andersonii.AAC.1
MGPRPPRPQSAASPSITLRSEQLQPQRNPYSTGGPGRELMWGAPRARGRLGAIGHSGRSGLARCARGAMVEAEQRCQAKGANGRWA